MDADQALCRIYLLVMAFVIGLPQSLNLVTNRAFILVISIYLQRI